MSKRLLYFAMLLILVVPLLLTACQPAAPEEAAPEEAAPEEAAPEEAAPEEMEEPAEEACHIKVGLITDATGVLAIYGAHIIRSFMLGMEYATGAAGSVGDVFTVEDGSNTFMLDGCEIEVLLGDDQTNPDLTTSVAREFVEVDEVDVLVGTVSSGNTATLQEIAAENETILIVAPAAANDITGAGFNEYTFRTSRENYQDAMALCEYATQTYDSFVQIAPDYSFGWGGAAAYRDACTLFGGTFPVDDIYAPFDTTDFTPYMEQILDSGADAWIPTWAGGGFIAIMQAAVDLGVVDEMDMAASFVDNVALPAFFGNSVGSTGSILYHYSAPDNPVNDWLIEETKARYGVYPDLFDGDGANAAILLVEALKLTEGDTTAAVMITAMEALEFDGPKGTVYIRPEDHVAIQDMYVMKLLNLDDPEAMFFEYITTTRPEPPCLLPEGLKDRCGDLPYGSLTGEVVAKTEAEEAPSGLVCDEPIKVGLITDATGVLAIYGAHIWRSFMLGMEYGTGAPGSVGEVFAVEDVSNTFMLDGCEIEVILGDDQTNPDLTTSVAREFIEVDEVDVLVGTVSSGNTATLQEMAAENQIPLIVAPAAANDITGVNFNKYTFRTSRENYQDAIALCEHLVKEYSTFAQIAPDYSFGWGGAAAYRDACTLLGGEFLIDDIFAPFDTTDFTPYMEQVLDSGAEVWIPTWAGGGFIAIMQSAIDLGVTDEMVMGANFVDNVALPAFFGNSVGSTGASLYHYTGPDNQINDWLIAEDQARYGVYPDLFDADGFNAALMLIEGLKATGGDAGADALIAAWEGLEFEGPKGTIYIRPEDHVAIQDMYVFTLLNVDDPDAKFFEYIGVNRPEPPCLLPEELKDRCGDLPYGNLSGDG
ncbi:MAG: substrate-binding domain-containing protein [Anaerolineales bacterium]|nr:substrate-binding domain-containing protein [Anaerolineales bacterium]